MMRKVIGERSSGYAAMLFIIIFILMMLLIYIVSVVSSVDRFDNGAISFLIIIGLVIFIFIGFFTCHVRKPLHMIEADDEFIFINYKDKTEKISLEEILHATPRAMQARSLRYTFGSIIIHTKEKDYKIGTIGSVEDVAFEIMKVVREKTV
ncbi:MAG: hypothetical protein CVV61_02220 [Tenericutes bacterium HGW-Tenericutes-6]|nr:MAG: hypothetical protein CVV61_02220 [Tenericutes bacterium HGW-Tenericutes-6]